MRITFSEFVSTSIFTFGLFLCRPPPLSLSLFPFVAPNYYLVGSSYVIDSLGYVVGLSLSRISNRKSSI